MAFVSAVRYAVGVGKADASGLYVESTAGERADLEMEAYWESPRL